MPVVTPQYYIPGAIGGVAGIDSLMVTDKLYANITRLDFTKTTGTYKIITLPKFCILEQVIVYNSAEFNGTIKLGKSGSDEEYVADAAYPKTVGLQNPMMIGAPIAASTVIQLKTSGNTTGAGICWLVWRPLP